MRAVLVLAGLCLVPLQLSATTGPPVDISISARSKGAERIVTATIGDVRASFETSEFGDGLIVSHVLLRVEETMKGAPADTLWVDVEGGTVGDLTLNVSDMPTMRVGKRAVFFLRRAATGEYVPHLRGLGIVALDASNRVPGSDLTLSSIRNMVAAR